MSADSTPLTVLAEPLGDVTAVRPRGVLDSRTYRPLRDTIIKTALEEPRAVVVDVSNLEVPAESALAVFTSARWHVGRWPEIPVLLVCEHQELRSALARNGITRYVPSYASMQAAMDALAVGDSVQVRRRARAELPGTVASLQRARELVVEWLTAWAVPELIPTTKVVATTLVENVLQHTTSRPGLRVESKDSTVTVAVSDVSHQPAGLREDSAHSATPSGLRIVAALCRAWGNAPNTAGKTVWAVIGPENAV
ncbi:sulfate transporter [Mycobacterium sp. GA-1285]|uniref:STAS domain-containing protein n=1 Tax=Mycobacterium sp. GA-1285 TaxID=1772282 RepID=UPI00074862E0|nr:STAS domain-containing protein [Mycobacterium sp. GA-1285]KUI20290.1 sulfate transporter [Mycobacterium sp. GA-1285]